MRVYKFRAICNDAGYGNEEHYLKMIYSETINQIAFGDEVDEVALFVDGKWLKVKKETVGQYTGLKDKNGTEIYEGDKLHKEGYWDIQVEFENGSFYVRNTDKVQYANKITNVPINYFGIEQYEVIGNIYEEELLEGRE